MSDLPAKQSVFKSFANGVVKSSTVIGGLYVVRGYMRDRLEDVKVKMEEEGRAKDILRTRFLQTHEDTSYTVLALLTTLSSQVLQTMDIDALTRELQTRSRARNSRHLEPGLPVQEPALNNNNSRPPSSLASSIDLVSGPPSGPVSAFAHAELSYPPNPYPATDSNAASSYFSLSLPGTSELSSRDADSPLTAISSSFISDAGSVAQSWIVESDNVERSRSPAVSSVDNSTSNSETGSAVGEGDDQRMSESVLSTTTNTTSTSTESDLLNANDPRSKAQIWNEVKILTFTRTLTTLYSSTLLCLLTTLQLTLLARAKYVSFVIAQAKEERRREKIEAEFGGAFGVGGLLVGSLVKGAVGSLAGRFGFGGARREGDEAGDGALEKLLTALADNLEKGGDVNAVVDSDDELGQGQLDDEGWGLGWAPSQKTKPGGGRQHQHGQPWMGEISEEVESKYLTMSWWLLHVGWKDVGERVRRGVDEVFDGVSLKTKLGAVDLHRLVGDVRRRVEHEVTFEGNEKRTTFISSLLPPTPETIHHVLTQGGYTSSSSPSAGIPYDLLNQNQLDLGRDLRLHDAQSSSTLPSQQYHQQQHSRHERMHSNSSTSRESSQLSHNFVNSPALAVSTRHPQQNPAHTYLTPEPPQPHDPSLLDPPFLALLDETRVILASPDFARVLELCLDKATEVLFDGLEKNIFGRAGGIDSTGEEEERIRLAGLLPGLARWSQLALDGLPNELVDTILNMREVSCLSAIAFGRFEEKFCS